MSVDLVPAAPRPLPKCATCGMRHRALVLAFPAAKPDPNDCIRALAEVVCALTLALAGDARPLNVVVKTLYGEG